MTNKREKQRPIDEWDEEPLKNLVIKTLIVLLLLVVSMWAFVQSAHSQTVCDTIPIQSDCVLSIHPQSSKSGKSVKYYVVYNYGGDSDITTMSKSVVEYVQMCKKMGIKPKLALRIKNGEIVSIIKGSKHGKIDEGRLCK